MDPLFKAAADEPLLTAIRCRQCSYVDFPAQAYGCRRCGAYGDDLVAAQLPAYGTVLTSAVVHHHPDRAVEVPFTVAVVELDGGPVTRVVMRDTAPLAIGDAVRGELVATADGAVDLRFAAVPAAAGGLAAAGDPA